MSIHKITEKIKAIANKPHGKDILSFMVILGVSLGSFYLGRNSTTNDTSSQIKILAPAEIKTQKITQTTDAQTLNTSENTKAGGDLYAKGNYLASSRGKKYYPVDCPSANNIKIENRIYFKTASDAEKQGYTLSTSCN